MIIDCLGCLHGHYPKLEGGDLLIITGDLTASDRPYQYHQFKDWLKEQKYKKKVFIAGNHDRCIQKGIFTFSNEWIGGDYLCDSKTEFEGLTIWGSPHSLWFEGINPHCDAFMGNEEYLKSKYEGIPENCDIIISHTPFNGTLDKNRHDKHCGSFELREVIERVKPKIFICSHIHEQGGNEFIYKHEGPNTWCVNCSIMNENYQPVNEPVRLIL